jgi:hypothetical protein
MKSLFIIAASAALALTVVGCGGPPSQLEACKHYCDKQGDCVKASSADIAACKNDCNAAAATWSDNDKLIETNCKNADSVKQAIYDCYGDFCDNQLVQNCANTAAQSKCEPK